MLGTDGEAARDSDTMALLNWGLPKFQRIRAVVEGKVMAKVPIRDRQGATLSLAPDRTVRRIIERGKRDEVKLKVVAPDVVDGPIRSGQRLGRVEVRQDGRLVATVALVAKSAVAAPTPTPVTTPAAAAVARAILAVRPRRGPDFRRVVRFMVNVLGCVGGAFERRIRGRAAGRSRGG